MARKPGQFVIDENGRRRQVGEPTRHHPNGDRARSADGAERRRIGLEGAKPPEPAPTGDKPSRTKVKGT